MLLFCSSNARNPAPAERNAIVVTFVGFAGGQPTAKLPGGEISEIAVNARLTFIEHAKPKDELECAFLIQIARLPELTAPIEMPP